MALEDGYYWVVSPLILPELTVEVGKIIFITRRPKQTKWVVRACGSLYRVGYIDAAALQKVKYDR